MVVLFISVYIWFSMEIFILSVFMHFLYKYVSLYNG